MAQQVTYIYSPTHPATPAAPGYTYYTSPSQPGTPVTSSPYASLSHSFAHPNPHHTIYATPGPTTGPPAPMIPSSATFGTPASMSPMTPSSGSYPSMHHSHSSYSLSTYTSSSAPSPTPGGPYPHPTLTHSHSHPHLPVQVNVNVSALPMTASHGTGLPLELRSSPYAGEFTSFAPPDPYVVATGKGDGEPVRRQRVSMACAYCRKRKIRCDGAEPCTNCTRASRTCDYHAIPAEESTRCAKARKLAHAIKMSSGGNVLLKQDLSSSSISSLATGPESPVEYMISSAMKTEDDDADGSAPSAVASRSGSMSGLVMFREDKKKRKSKSSIDGGKPLSISTVTVVPAPLPPQPSPGLAPSPFAYTSFDSTPIIIAPALGPVEPTSAKSQTTFFTSPFPMVAAHAQTGPAMGTVSIQGYAPETVSNGNSSTSTPGAVSERSNSISTASSAFSPTPNVGGTSGLVHPRPAHGPAQFTGFNSPPYTPYNAQDPTGTPQVIDLSHTPDLVTPGSMYESQPFVRPIYPSRPGMPKQTMSAIHIPQTRLPSTPFSWSPANHSAPVTPVTKPNLQRYYTSIQGYDGGFNMSMPTEPAPTSTYVPPTMPGGGMVGLGIVMPDNVVYNSMQGTTMAPPPPYTAY